MSHLRNDTRCNSQLAVPIPAQLADQDRIGAHRGRSREPPRCPRTRWLGPTPARDPTNDQQACRAASAPLLQNLATNEDAPVGGLDFFVTLLVQGASRDVAMSATVGARFRGWGDLRTEHVALLAWAPV